MSCFALSDIPCSDRMCFASILASSSLIFKTFCLVLYESCTTRFDHIYPRCPPYSSQIYLSSYSVNLLRVPPFLVLEEQFFV